MINNSLNPAINHHIFFFNRRRSMRSSSILYCDFYNLGIENIQALVCDKCGFGVYMILIVHVRIQLINDG